MDLILAAAIQLVVLHRIDGGTVTFNPAQVTALHPPATGKLITKPANCAVWLTDGKFLAVVESCDQIKAMLEAAPP